MSLPINFIRSTVVVLLLLLIGATASAQNPTPADAAYHKLADEYLAGHLAWRPQEAVGLGLHEFDGKAPDLSKASVDREHERLRSYRSRLSAIDGKTLSRRADIQRRLLVASIDNELFGFEIMKSHSHNPMTYAGALDVNIYAKRDFAPKPDRLRSVIAILKHMPDVMDAARENLDDVLPKPYVDTAMLNAEGGAKFLESDLVEAFKDVNDAELQAEFQTVNSKAVAELRRYVQYLKTEKLPKADQKFAIGRENFTRMLQERELISQTPEDILAIGLRELAKEQEIFTKTAARIDSTKPAVKVYDEVQKDHPTAASLLPDTRKHLEKIRGFLTTKDLVAFPSDVRVTVDETPKYARANSFASMDSPGPFETKSTQAYYYVTPVEPDWDAKRAEEWLTAFNFYTTDVVSIHEAYPGHYVQFLHVQASDADRLDKVFGSYAFIEGWAHYCEQMVIDEGFGKDEGQLVADKYRLAQSAEALLRLCRLCVSIKMHTQGMSLDDGTKFFMEHCHYAEATAKSEANRGTFDPAYCSYTIGKLQLLKLRDEYRQQEGANFSLKKFHDEVLRHGAPPVRLLREVMLKDESKWKASL